MPEPLQPINPSGAPETIDVSSTNTMQLPKRNGGKVVLLIVLAIMLIAASIGGVWYYMNNKAKQEKSQTQAQIDQLNAQVADLQKQLDAANQVPSVAAGKTIKSLYDLWINGTANNTDKNTLITESVNKGLVTTELEAALKSGKTNVLCSVTKPQSYVYTISSATDKKVVSAVVISGTNKQGANVDVTNVENAWKVSNISCLALQ
jgi:outer membrane murein-binding lipoprotein Lpp